MTEINTIKEAIDFYFSLKSSIIANKSSPSTDTFYRYLGTSKYLFGLWFRGELDHGSSSLTPSIFRGPKLLNETGIYKYLPSINKEIRNLSLPFDRLCMMQHYNIPSRLLDWTESILIALYFAVENNDDPKDGKLYCLNAILLNDLTSLRKPIDNIHHAIDFGTKFRTYMVTSETQEDWANQTGGLRKDFNWKHPQLNTNVFTALGVSHKNIEHNDVDMLKIFSTPIGVMPNRINSRIIHQNGNFTLHGGKINTNTNIEPDEKIPEPNGLLNLHSAQKSNGFNFLKECKIPASKKESIKDELMNLGIHQGALFPELDKQAEFIKNLI